MTATAATKLVFLAGDPIGHTKGYPEYKAAFAAAGLDAAYLPAHVQAGHLRDFLVGLRWAHNVAGVVATVPHKLEALAAAKPDDRARRAGAANVLRPDGAGGWEATQLDGDGFLAAADAAGIPLTGQSIQILGAGGAGRAVAWAIATRTPARLRIHDPDPARQAELVADLRRDYPHLEATPGLERSAVLVNCSTIGMGDDDRLPLPLDLIPEAGAVYDIVNREDTPLLRAAASRGCRCAHGRSMMLAEIPLIVRYLFG